MGVSLSFLVFVLPYKKMRDVRTVSCWLSTERRTRCHASFECCTSPEHRTEQCMLI